MRTFTALLIACTMAALPLWGQEDWEHIREEDGVNVWAKETGGGQYYEIKAVTTAKTSVDGLVYALQQADNYAEWIYAAEESRLLKREDNLTFHYYMLSDVPWPASDRDMVVRTEIRQEADGTVKTSSTNIPTDIPPKDGVKRLAFLEASWTFRPLPGDEVEITYYGKLKPEAQLPGWLKDEIYNVAPFNTVKGLRKLSEKSMYAYKDLPYIK